MIVLNGPTLPDSSRSRSRSAEAQSTASRCFLDKNWYRGFFTSCLPIADIYRCKLSAIAETITGNGGHSAKVVPSVAFQTGLIGDAGGFGRVFFGIAGFLAVVFLPDPPDGSDGEESTVLTKRTSISSRIVLIEPAGLVGLIGRAGTLWWRSLGDCIGFSGGYTPGFTLIRYSSTNTTATSF